MPPDGFALLLFSIHVLCMFTQTPGFNSIHERTTRKFYHSPRGHQQLTATIQRPPGINSNHPEPSEERTASTQKPPGPLQHPCRDHFGMFLKTAIFAAILPQFSTIFSWGGAQPPAPPLLTTRHHLGWGCVGAGSHTTPPPLGATHPQPAYAFSTLCKLKNGNFRNRFFDILTIHNNQISYVM